MNNLTLDTEFAKGWLARAIGIAREKNQWKQGTALARSWDNGWLAYDTMHPFDL